MPELNIGSQSEDLDSGDFELVVQIRNYKGEPTGKTKSIRHSDPVKIAEFWHRMTGKPKRRKRRKANRKDVLPTKQEAEKILRDLNQE